MTDHASTHSIGFGVAMTAYWLLTSGAQTAYMVIQDDDSSISWLRTLAFCAFVATGGILASAYGSVSIAWLFGLVATIVVATHRRRRGAQRPKGGESLLGTTARIDPNA
jgi:hypothetical protein